MAEWIILNARDMLCGEYDDREEAFDACRALNADPHKLSLYRVEQAPKSSRRK
jgi:hypothetical protein